MPFRRMRTSGASPFLLALCVQQWRWRVTGKLRNRAYETWYNAYCHQLFASHSDEAGGYDYKFVDEVLPKYICLICDKTLRDAQLTLCCGQHFCDSCVKQWLSKKAQKTQKTCPYCRQTDFQSVLNKEKIREVNELRVYCTHKVKGCKWVGELGAIKQHLEENKGCRYVNVECTNEFCYELMERRHLTKHLEQECIERMYICEYCGYKDTYNVIAGDGRKFPWSYQTKNHYEECGNYPLECPNQCGKTDIKRKDMGTHRDSCKLEPLNCPFKYVGCTDKIHRQDMADHQQKNMEKHMLMLARDHERLFRQVEKLTASKKK